MGIIEGVLQEELQRIRSNIVSYEELLSKCHKGTVVVQKISKGQYAYLKYRENGKVISVYLGRFDSAKSKMAQASVKEYKRISLNIKKAKEEERKLERAIKSYE